MVNKKKYIIAVQNKNSRFFNEEALRKPLPKVVLATGQERNDFPIGALATVENWYLISDLRFTAWRGFDFGPVFE